MAYEILHWLGDLILVFWTDGHLILYKMWSHMYFHFLLIPSRWCDRVVSKISSYRVNTTSRRGIKQLGVSFGSVFFYFTLQVAGATFIVAGGNPRRPPLNDCPMRSIDDFLCELSPVFMEKRCPGKEGHLSSRVNFSERYMRKVFNPLSKITALANAQIVLPWPSWPRWSS